jgi:hypothetical protein
MVQVCLCQCQESFARRNCLAALQGRCRMARSRTLKAEFWIDEVIVELSFPARLFYQGCWNFAICDHGHLDDSPKSLKQSWRATRHVRRVLRPGRQFAIGVPFRPAHGWRVMSGRAAASHYVGTVS